ncbi:unnamed protein product [Allacma fusca]|uniref:Uncharacterized protein n=1 Tax=Allacma fusca TaxID=39272 RepID=A0A8J2LB49_9HEXA|nr:unnamed protein product [Allacma fusca]
MQKGPFKHILYEGAPIYPHVSISFMSIPRSMNVQYKNHSRPSASNGMYRHPQSLFIPLPFGPLKATMELGGGDDRDFIEPRTRDKTADRRVHWPGTQFFIVPKITSI